MKDLISYNLPDEQLFSIVLNLPQDSYSQFTAPFIDFLRSNDYGINYTGIKAYADFINDKYDNGVITANTFNVYISTAKNRTRLLFNNSKSALDIGKRFFFEQKLSDIKLKKPSKIVPDDKCLTKDEVQKLVDNCKDESFKLLIEFLFATGLRIFECLNIRFTDIEKIDNRYRIRIRGKGGKERFIKVKMDLIDRVNEYYNQDREKLFQYSKYGTLYTYQNVSTKIKNLSKKILNKSIGVHSTRHGFVTTMIQAGKDIKEVSLYVGHQSVSITYDMYYHGKLGDNDLNEVELN